MKKPLYSTKEWRRHGVTKECQLSIKASGVQDFLLSCLPEDFKLYSLISSYYTKLKNSSEYFNVLREIRLDDLNHEYSEGVSQYFIRSKKLTPNISLEAIDNSNEFLVLNGLISLQVFKYFRGVTVSPTLLIVDSIINRQSKSKVFHKKYYQISETLKELLPIYSMKRLKARDTPV
ncbi:hypothetical protein [Pleionea sp. CnH1-48]|uniref:hypothetical protein n=1 Tax=Pleionea sp. CnH1-48 TaxID=2954494 RepID=UPI002096BBE6|nr:hypothetical protein [Pleionea sp. CnH1-48]MCO7223559.1 hypothetical protein [Pleionea sp. CnH1-48]